MACGRLSDLVQLEVYDPFDLPIQKPTLELNMKWIGWPVAEISPYFYFMQKLWWRIPNCRPPFTIPL